ncbi:Cps2A family protein [Buttiauxella noackiae ATCC 51607]|uniref:Cps2A family protein n=1 Tax=Buttiauxella noackiae ATCC 51607 TaxID=1354255 RepID=A0A1B7HM77_9ENTR|nr:CDP-glycerol glycerophosphotransferase family protein [Buttiauxella noackiae]OAT16717.1 Cps2A family protein [Buttiauxella noackiae ATCC 51607]
MIEDANCKKHCIGFLMETSFHYEVYRNIILALLNDNSECQVIINDLIEDGFVNNMLSFLSTIEIPELGFILLSSVLKNGKIYDALITPYYLSYAEDIAKVHVRAVYGLAKNEWNHAAWNKKYHRILCYSKYTYDALALPEHTKIVGNPRFDDWHKRNYSKVELDYLKMDPAKPTILYAPTYGELSSLPHWAKKLSRLRNEYNIITKLHHGTLYKMSERQALKIAKRFLRDIVQEKTSIFQLLEIADYVISDNSGFIFDAINADKSIILLDWAEMPDLLKNNRTFSTCDSPEQLVRQYLPVAMEMDDIRRYLSGDYPRDNNTREISRIKIEYCDAFNDGNAGVRSAQVIIDAITNAP